MKYVEHIYVLLKLFRYLNLRLEFAFHEFVNKAFVKGQQKPFNASESKDVSIIFPVFLFRQYRLLHNVERVLFQQAECNLNFNLHNNLLCFQIHKGIPSIEHTKMKPKTFSTQGRFNQSISIYLYVIYDEVQKHPIFTLTTAHFHINNRSFSH